MVRQKNMHHGVLQQAHALVIFRVERAKESVRREPADYVIPADHNRAENGFPQVE